MILGGVGVVTSTQEMWLSMGSTSEPVPTNVADLESGQKLGSYHVALDKHLALYPAAGVEYYTNKKKPEEPTETTKITSVFYPVISANHPDADTIVKALNSEDGDTSALNSQVRVIIHSSKFATVADVPGEVMEETGVRGTIESSVRSLSDDEVKILRESFPGLDTAKVVILEEGKKPASMLKLALLAAASGLAAAFGAFMGFQTIKELFANR